MSVDQSINQSVFDMAYNSM